jgi:hypothetical protein
MTKAQQIKDLKEQGLTHKQIAEQLDVSVGYVSQVVNWHDPPVDLSKPQFKGISWDRNQKKYTVRVHGMFIGRYKEIDDAIHFRNKAAISLWGFEEADRRGYYYPPHPTGE